MCSHTSGALPLQRGLHRLDPPGSGLLQLGELASTSCRTRRCTISSRSPLSNSDRCSPAADTLNAPAITSAVAIGRSLSHHLQRTLTEFLRIRHLALGSHEHWRTILPEASPVNSDQCPLNPAKPSAPHQRPQLKLRCRGPRAPSHRACAEDLIQPLDDDIDALGPVSSR